MKTLYKRSTNGQLVFWTIVPTLDELVMTWGTVDGEVQEKRVEVIEKANRTLDEQIELEMNSRISKKLDAGYVFNKERAKNAVEVTTAFGFQKPMLAHRFDKHPNVNMDDAIIQYKYDGHRCLIHRDGNEIIAYSRNGKLITTIDEILDDVVMPDGATLDGELYLHGHSLQKITSLVKRQQPQTSMLDFVCYDIISPSRYIDRLKMIQQIVDTCSNDRLVLAPAFWYAGLEDVPSLLDRAQARGYEGLIIRPDNFGYENKRSKGLIKVKSWFDDEFQVVAIDKSKDGWAVLTCEMESGVEFDCSAPGTLAERTEVWNNREAYLGRWVNVQYANLTDGGKPFHPVATMWRDVSEE